MNTQLPDSIQTYLKQQLQTIQEGTTANGPHVAMSDGNDWDLQIDAQLPTDGAAIPLITRTFAVAMPFPTIADSITVQSLLNFWHGKPDALNYVTNNGSIPTLYVDNETQSALVLLLGKPDTHALIQIVASDELITRTWESRPGSFAILPFDTLETRWKLIWLDGINLFDKHYDGKNYPLTLRIWAVGHNTMATALAKQIKPLDNRETDKMAIVAMTGTTAMVRGTAVQMERKGITYPGEAIRDWMVSADVRHVSNEVSFWDNCPAPTFNDGLSMCSNPKYMGLLKYVGVNLIELSGNHLWDKGWEPLSSTLKFYDDQGLKYFAGGRTYTDSLKAITITVGGNQLAFVGCNWFGSDWATLDNGLPGSALCGSDNPRSLDLITTSIKTLSDEGYLVIATIQYEEIYDYSPTPAQVRDFSALRDAGAVVVNGSQGHWVQGFDVNAKGFLHYGVGNLFFGDQEGIGTHQSFIDRHVFYAGRYLGVELRTAFIEDYSKPVPMQTRDRAKLLQALFAATGY